jgi:hypothetical protein
MSRGAAIFLAAQSLTPEKRAEYDSMRRRRTWSTLGCFTLPIAVVVGILTVVNVIQQHHDTVDSTDAWVTCQQFVRDSLKSPTSARFASTLDSTITNSGDGTYTVASYVDARNSFGVALREQYTCTVHYAGHGKWSLLRLTGLH